MFAADPRAIVQPSDESDQSDVIEVVGTRRDQALKIDRRTYQVQQNPHTAQKDSVQLLRGLPAITITPDDQILLLGSGNAKIFVDGRPLSDPDAIAYLRTLHGSDLERIEVITNPSAQYSGEGAGGIINFVLRKKQGEGVSGNASAELSGLGHGYVDATAKTKRGKWTYEFHAGGRLGTSARSTYHKRRSIEAVPGGAATVNTEDGGGPTRGAEGEGSAKVSYDLDLRTSVSAKILGAAARDVTTRSADFAGLTPDFASFTERQRFSNALSFVITELNFDHKGKKEGETLNGSLRVFANPRDHEGNRADFSNAGALSVDKRKRLLYANGQVDWQHPMGKSEILSVGGSWDYAQMSERYRFTSVGSDGSLGSDASDQFRGVDNKFAAYATFQQPIGGWTVMPGLRLERGSRHISSPGQADIDIRRTDVFPTLHIDRSLSKTLDLTFSYSKRIDRPHLNDLRPYPLVQDVLTIKQGNPRLKNQATDSYEVNFHYRRNKLDVGVIVYDRETSRLWSPVYTVVNGVNVFTIVNAGRSRDRGAEFDVSTPVVERVKFNASMNLFDQRVPIDHCGRRGERGHVSLHDQRDAGMGRSGPPQSARRRRAAAVDLQQPVASVSVPRFPLESAELVLHPQLQPDRVAVGNNELPGVQQSPPARTAGAGILQPAQPARVQAEAAEDVRQALAPEALLELGHFPFVVTAEGEEGVERGEGASPERLAQPRLLGKRGADLLFLERRIAFGLLDHHLFGLDDQPGLQLPIAADALCRLRRPRRSARAAILRPAGPSGQLTGPQRFQLALVLGAFRLQPLLRFGRAEVEDRHQRNRREHGRAHHRQQRSVGELVEKRVQRDRDQIARRKPPQVKVEIARGFARLALGELVRDRGEEGERGSVHHRRAKPADDPRTRTIIGEAHQVDDVLEDRETGADGETRDDRVELVADAVEAEEGDDDHALDRLLDPRRDEAAVAVESRLASVSRKRPATG